MKTITRTLYCVIFIVLFACSYEDITTVTIDTGIRKQVQLSWFDRAIAFLSIAQPLQADTPPGDLPWPVDLITVTVTAPDMNAITKEIPLDTGKITMEIPAGSQRKFEVVAFYNNDGTFERQFGGIKTADLSPGQSVYLNIEMGQLTPIQPLWDPYENRVNIQYDTYFTKPIYFKVYQYIGVGGPYVYNLIDIVEVDSLDFQILSETLIEYHYTNDSINSGTYTGFYISAVSKYGESEKFYIDLIPM